MVPGSARALELIAELDPGISVRARRVSANVLGRLLERSRRHRFRSRATREAHVAALRRPARQEVGRGFDDSEHEQSDGRKEQDQAGYGDPWCPFAFAVALNFVKVFHLARGCPDWP
jgi:hypothetical protein